MIVIKKGNLLEAPEDILVHQVNIGGIIRWRGCQTNS